MLNRSFVTSVALIPLLLSVACADKKSTSPAAAGAAGQEASGGASGGTAGESSAPGGGSAGEVPTAGRGGAATGGVGGSTSGAAGEPSATGGVGGTGGAATGGGAGADTGGVAGASADTGGVAGASAAGAPGTAGSAGAAGQAPVVSDVCGDGVLGPSETCEDQNLTAGDGCSELCRAEAGHVWEREDNDGLTRATLLPAGDALAHGSIFRIGDFDYYRLELAGTTDLKVEILDPGVGSTTCAGTYSQAELLASDGATRLAWGQVDADYGGCTAFEWRGDSEVAQLAAGTYYLLVRQRWDTATIPAYQLAVTLEGNCGDGAVTANEECDTASSVPCDELCQRLPVCGDTFVDPPEGCDDGALATGDGCSDACLPEYTAESEQNASFAQADASTVQLSTPTMLRGSIGVAGDEDTTRLQVADPGYYVFHMTTDARGVECGLTTQQAQLGVFGSPPGASPDIYDAGDVYTYRCAEQVAWLEAGTHYVRVSEVGSDGTFPLYMLGIQALPTVTQEVEDNGLPELATVGTGRQLVFEASASSGEDVDYFSVTVPAGKALFAQTFGIHGSSCSRTGNIDTILDVFDITESDLALEWNDDRGLQGIDDTSLRNYCSLIAGFRNESHQDRQYHLKVSPWGWASAWDYGLAVTIRE